MSQPPPGERPPADAAEALARARRHAQAAAAESLAAIRALLDAGALASGGEPADSHRLLGPLARLLAGLEGRLAGEGGDDSVLAALAEALDVEIARWEARARDDGDARAVLRAFLGLRELLWEFGVRAPAGPDGSGPHGAAAADEEPTRRARGARRPPRVQRVRVEG